MRGARIVTMTRIKLVLTLLALVVFAIGAQRDEPRLRWVAIGLLAVAFLLRFARGRSSDSEE